MTSQRAYSLKANNLACLSCLVEFTDWLETNVLLESPQRDVPATSCFPFNRLHKKNIHNNNIKNNISNTIIPPRQRSASCIVRLYMFSGASCLRHSCTRPASGNWLWPHNLTINNNRLCARAHTHTFDNQGDFTPLKHNYKPVTERPQKAD